MSVSDGDASPTTALTLPIARLANDLPAVLDRDNGDMAFEEVEEAPIIIADKSVVRLMSDR